MIQVQTLPTGAFEVKYWTEFYTLQYKKKKFIEANVEPRFGIQYFVWSRFKRCYYLRTLDEWSDMEEVKKLVVSGWVFLYPSQEHRDKIREEVTSSGMKYYQMNLYRSLVYELDLHERKGDKSFGYLTRKDEIEQAIYALTGSKT